MISNKKKNKVTFPSLLQLVMVIDLYKVETNMYKHNKCIQFSLPPINVHHFCAKTFFGIMLFVVYFG